MWKERNTDRHRRDKTESERNLVERIIQQTNKFYKVRNNVLPRHKNLFYQNLEEHKRKEETFCGLQQLMNTLGPLLRDSSESAKNLGINRMRTMAEYFTGSKNTEIHLISSQESDTD